MLNAFKSLLKTSLTLTLMSCTSLSVRALEPMDLNDVLDRPQGSLSKIPIEGGVVYDTLVLREIYRTRQYQPLWYANTGFTSRLPVARQILLNSYQHGLDPQRFWRPSMENFFARGEELNEVDFELAVTEAVLRYARTIYKGEVDPSLVDDDIKLSTKAFGSNELKQLASIINGEPQNMAKEIERFEPKFPLYQSLKNQLVQKNGQLTKEQFNKVKATMEKLRWFPNAPGDRYAFVNLATTELQVIENGAVVLAMKTVNGRPLRRTPMMIDSMRRVEINPTWTVPLNLAIWDKLPQIKRDIGFLDRLGIEVFRPGSSTPIEDVASINWSGLSRDYFPFILRQRAGPANVLGKVKFPLTNGFSIYMHDTDEKNLFKIEEPRLRSSGCVRLQKPMEMAGYLLKNQAVPIGKGWLQTDGSEYPIGTTFTEEILLSRVGQSSSNGVGIPTIGINVEKPLTVYTAYLTADLDASGNLRLVTDAYKQDERLLGILNNSGEGTPQFPPMVPLAKTQLVPVQINGELGPTQLFGNAVAIRCAVIPYKGCVDVDAKGVQTREEYHFRVNEEVMLPVGYYIVGAENTMLPGWLEVECNPDELSNCAPIRLNLEKITIPDEFGTAERVIVFRDVSSKVEGNKILSQGFHNGKALIKQTPIDSKNFYVPGINQSDVVERLTNDYCVPILKGKVKDVAPEVLKYCRSLSEVIGMAEYVELPVVIENDVVEGSSDQVKSYRKMKVFDFPAESQRGRNQNQWSQRWVSAPGTWIDFTHRRYLVSAPLFPQNISADRRFVAVLPGQYQMLAFDSQSNIIGQKTIRTENIDENYIPIMRKVILGE